MTEPLVKEISASTYFFVLKNYSSFNRPKQNIDS